MKLLLFFIFIQFLSLGLALAVSSGPVLPDQGVLERHTDSFYDPDINYAQFPARVTDKNPVGDVLKIQSETENIKFFRAGDEVKFKISTLLKNPPCTGHVRSVESPYFTIHINDIKQCWKQVEYFRRGSLLHFDSPILATRIKNASFFRLVLMQRKKDYLAQLNENNQFLWRFNELQVNAVAEFDLQIAEIEKRKQKALDDLIVKKKEASVLQQTLIRKLDEVDNDLLFYQIERQDIIVDRWFLDHDLGKPVSERPQELIKSDAGGPQGRRWEAKNFLEMGK